jgi:hypothetical protein
MLFELIKYHLFYRKETKKDIDIKMIKLKCGFLFRFTVPIPGTDGALLQNFLRDILGEN